MASSTYFIDAGSGDDAYDGLSAERPKRRLADLALCGGDTVRFKRGTVFRGILHACNGTENQPITYGAYGTGPKPVFMGSMVAGDPALWSEMQPSVWRCATSFPSEVCNLIFDDGASCGNLRWSIDALQNPGEWYYTGIGLSNGPEGAKAAGGPSHALYLRSPRNPGLAYRSIECALWGGRQLITGERDLIFEDLCFANSGVHGYQGIDARRLTIRNCDFRFIGGAVWDKQHRIRFGNAVEFWDGAGDITVTGCRFDNIYDSGVTHQGGRTINIPKNLRFTHNEFSDCGMSAYECREPSDEVYFEHNLSTNAGGGFSMQGDAPPRQSEIHPQPMGHHVFIWRIDPGTQTGTVYIRHNIFRDAPYGAAIYSIIEPADERRIILDHNAYRQKSGELLMRMGGKNYLPSEFARYQADNGQDRNSRLES